MGQGRNYRIAAVAVATAMAAGGAAVVASTVSSCAASPTNVPVRSFQQARNVDYLCIQYNDPDGGAAYGPTDNVGLSPDLCTQVPYGVTGSTLYNHMLALVTQATRGEVAVVDLTAGGIIDESHDTPGVNFIPVGAAPTGIVVAPDAKMTFVSSADTNKPAIYGIPTNGRVVPYPGDAGSRVIAGVVGDSTYQSYDNLPIAPMQITDLPVCALPQPPQSVSIVPMAPAQGGPPAGYVLVAVLSAMAGQPAEVVTIDPTGLLRGVGLDVADAGASSGDGAANLAEGGVADAEAGAGAAGAPAVTPGILAFCPILGSTPLSAPTGTIATVEPGVPWPDGVPYADAGDLAPQEPTAGPGCTAPEAGPVVVTAALGATPFPGHAVMRDDLPLLYVGDAQLPMIHVLDLSNPAQPVERAPLLATSLPQPSASNGPPPALRNVTVGDMALSPVTHDYKRYLYAIDQSNGSIMVFDVTDTATSPRIPMLRPHAELNPLAPRDRISFSSPVATVGFATHDWPIIPPGPNGAANPDQIHAATGLLCNPNPNANLDGGATGTSSASVLDLGFYYTATQVTVPNSAGTVQTIPLRLRGVFGFATLSTGQVVAIDVDDWDAPCRRPDPMTDGGPQGEGNRPNFNWAMTGLLDLPEPPAGPPGSPTFLDPYAAPFAEPGEQTTQASSVTQEAFFPVSAPNRIRSGQLLRNDPSAGNNAPNLVAAPSLTDVTGSQVSTGANGVAPLILPTALEHGFFDPSQVVDPTDPPGSQTELPDASILPSASTAPNVRLSFDDPTASQNQSWTVTYEGVLPTLNTVAADITPVPQTGDDGGVSYASLIFSIGQEVAPAGSIPTEASAPAAGLGPGFCERGVEDWDMGQQRAQQVVAALDDAGLPSPPNLKAWTSDYVEILDDPLQQGDPYWNVPNYCWGGAREGSLPPLPPLANGTTSLASSGGATDPQSIADARYNACNQTFGTGAPDTYLARDLPILRAYDDHLDVGRFFWPPSLVEQTANRVIVGADPSNENALRFVACCFHNQATFKVRAGGEWVAAGQNGIGFLHHVIAGPSENDSLAGGRPGFRCELSCDPHDVLLNSRSFDIPWVDIPWGAASGVSDAGVGAPADAGAEAARGNAEPGSIDAGSAPLFCTPSGPLPLILRTSPLALQNPYFSYVTWMGCGLPSTAADHTITPRDDAWRFQVGGGFSPLVISLTGNAVVDISPQSMRYIEPLGWLAVVDGQSQGLELIDLNAVNVVHNYY